MPHAPSLLPGAFVQATHATFSERQSGTFINGGEQLWYNLLSAHLELDFFRFVGFVTAGDAVI